MSDPAPSTTPPPPPPPPPAAAAAAAAECVATAYYDGSCPLCSTEIAFLRTFKRASAVRFVNLADPAFAPPPDASATRLLSEMHVRAPDGALHSRVAAFRALYTALGHGYALRWTASPLVEPLVDRAYAAFLRARPLLARLLR